MLDLDQQPGPDLVARLLRFAHTLKGAARVVKQQEIADRAHEFEEVLVPHRSGVERLPADEMRELLRLNDEIAPVRDRAGRSRGRAVGAARRPLDAGGRGCSTGDPRRPSSPATSRAPRAATADLDDLLDAIGEASARIAPLRDGTGSLAQLHRGVETLGDRMRIGRQQISDVTARADGAPARRRPGRPGPPPHRRGRPGGTGARRGARPGRRAAAGAGRHASSRRCTGPCATPPRPRASGSGSSAAAARCGWARSCSHQVSGAFLHVVRNAVVHGIEAEADRVAAGKPAEGTVAVEVERRGRWATFRCIDDGRGFDLAGAAPGGGGPRAAPARPRNRNRTN